MTRVLANGTFDLIHPGHLHYLKQSAQHGDDLVVVIARDSRAKTKKDTLLFDEDERQELVAAIDAVDKAILGSTESIFDTVQQIQPDIITLGYDQDFDKESLKAALREHGSDAAVIRIDEGPSFSSSDLKEHLQ